MALGNVPLGSRDSCAPIMRRPMSPNCSSGAATRATFLFLFSSGVLGFLEAPGVEAASTEQYLDTLLCFRVGRIEVARCCMDLRDGALQIVVIHLGVRGCLVCWELVQKFP